MEVAFHWMIEVMWSYSDHMVTGSEAIVGGYAYKATQHAYVAIKTRRAKRREARLIAESLTKE